MLVTSSELSTITVSILQRRELKIKEVNSSRFTVADPRFEPGQSESTICNHRVIPPLLLSKAFLLWRGKREIGLGGLVFKCRSVD